MLVETPNPRCQLDDFIQIKSEKGKKREKGSFSIGTMDLVLEVYVVTSSGDSRVDRIKCAGSPSLSRLFLRMVQWRDG